MRTRLVAGLALFLALAGPCPAQPAPTAQAQWDRSLGEVETFQSARRDGRPLTPGEIELARKVFRTGVDYSAVRVHDRKWWPLQPQTTAMTPNGSMYFSPDFPCFSDDFSDDSKLRFHLYSAAFCRRIFMHEMTHVYQHQQGIRVVSRRLSEGGNQRYTLDPAKTLNDYSLEQQAEIVAEYFECLEYHKDLSALAPVLRGFLENPDFLRADEEARRRRAPRQLTFNNS